MSSSTSKYLSKLRDKRVLVLGGTSGLGFCVAEAALEHDAYVIVSSSTQAKIDKTISRLQASYPDKAAKISGHVCDLAQLPNMEANVEALLEAATDGNTKKIDHIVSTAGDRIQFPKLSELTVESVQNCGTVRFVGPLVLAKYAPPYMTPGFRSSITLTNGTISYKPFKDRAVTAAWGMGIEGAMRGMAVDLAPIRVNIVSPGAVVTELFDGAPEGMLETFRKATLTEQLGTPEDVAEAYLHTMKDGFMTGNVLVSDGGRILT
ncbi:MAG: hypothetical protein L6R36_009344 [Xanthoria steineri]|nr:MAG: hypothetical protein L6R36_009344 [Xanthoria steineri]